MNGTVRIHGAVELERAFRALNRDLGKGVREALENAAEPVRQNAQELVRTGISGMARVNLPWYQMRTGSTLRTVYVAPVQRGARQVGSRKRRPNLANRMAPLMEQALEQNSPQVEGQVLETLDDLFRAWGAGG